MGRVSPGSPQLADTAVNFGTELAGLGILSRGDVWPSRAINGWIKMTSRHLGLVGARTKPVLKTHRGPREATIVNSVFQMKC